MTVIGLKPDRPSIAQIEADLAAKKEQIFKALDEGEYFHILDELQGLDDRADIIDYYVLLRRYHNSVEDKLAEVKKVIMQLEDNVIPDLLKDEDEFGMSTGYRTEKSPRLGYTVYVGTENYVSLPDKPTAFAFLREHEYGDAIEETVHHKRLPSIYREINEKGIEVPEGLFKVSTKHKARLRNV